MALDFEKSGADQFLETATAAVTDTPMSLAAWVKPETTGDTHIVVGVYDESVSNRRVSLSYSGSNMQALIRGSSGAGLATASGVTTGAWQHLAGSFTGTEQRAFFNGVPGTLNSKTTALSGIDTTTIGRNGDSNNTDFTDGVIAEVGIWDVVLSDSEFIALGNGVPPSRVRPQNLKGYWPLYGRGSPEPDLSGNGVHITVNGSPAQADHSPTLMPFGYDPILISSAAVVRRVIVIE